MKQDQTHMRWEPALRDTDLWGDEMAGRLATALGDRQREEAARLDQLRKFGALAAQGRDQAPAEKLQKLIAGAPAEVAPTPTRTAVTPLARVPVPRSCVTAFGPYNDWAHGGDGRVRAATADEAPDTLSLHARVVRDEGDDHLTLGRGCWVQAAETGVHRLVVHFRHNSHNIVSGGFGYATGSLRFAGSVWGAGENRWVDRGGFGVTLSDAAYWSSWNPPTEDTIFSGEFDAIAGGAYYCAGRIVIYAGAWGLFSVANVESFAIMDFLEVCTVP